MGSTASPGVIGLVARYRSTTSYLFCRVIDVVSSSRAPRLKAIDLFCGAGGLSAGLKAAGHEVTFGIDQDKDACESYSVNHPGTDIECDDITRFSARDLLKRVGGDVDVVVGGPSCQGFSSAGRRNDHELGWVRVGDERNELWKHQFEIVEGLRPRAFLLENVPGFMSFQKGKFGPAVLAEFKRLGYDVSCEVLLAANYGLPQLRRRMFIVGVAEGYKFEFPAPTHLGGWRRDHLEKWEEERRRRRLKRHITCWEALADLPLLTGDRPVDPTKYASAPRSDYARLVRGEETRLREHELIALSDSDLALISHVPPGGTWRDIPPHLLPDRFRGMRRTDSTNLLGRLDPQRPAYTMTTQFHNVTTGCQTHPFEDRSLTVREGARIQSFSDDYRFVGSTSSKCRQIGNAVPPRLGHFLAAAITDALVEPAKRKGWTRRPAAVKPASAVPTPASPTTAERMRRQKRTGTKPEVQLRKALHARGLRYRVDDRPLVDLPRRADMTFRRAKVAVFVDGCFWHGCPVHSRPTKSNTKWWGDKIARNRERDEETTRLLEAAGWLVVRVWEHETPEDSANRVHSIVAARLGEGVSDRARPLAASGPASE